MVGTLVKIIFLILLFQLVAGIGRMFRRPRRRDNPREDGDDRVKNPDYGHLTEHEIEDADFEELPKE